MPVTMITASYVFTCDGCGAHENKLSNSQPMHWTTLKIERDLHDFQGAPVASGNIKRILCAKCGSVVIDAMNKAIEDAKHA